MDRHATIQHRPDRDTGPADYRENLETDMNATVTYVLSTLGQKASILAGGDGKADQTIIVYHGDPLFASTLAHADVDREGGVTLHTGRHYGRTLWDHVPTLGEILMDVEDRLLRERTAEQDEARKATITTAACLAQRRTRTATRYNAEPYGYYPVVESDRPIVVDESITTSPEWVAWEAELTVQNDAARDEWIATMTAVAEAEKVAADEAKASEDVRRELLDLRPGDIDCEFSSGALTEVPIWEPHKRGTNWMAKIVVDPNSPGGLSRTFAEKAKGDSYYLLTPLLTGQAIEFGADYSSASGNKTRKRWFGYVVRVDDEGEDSSGRLVLHQCGTGKQAVKDGEKHATEVMAELEAAVAAEQPTG